MSQHALDLRSLRTEIAKQLEETVNSHLRDLGMESTRLTVYIEEMKKVRANGAETVSFMIETDNNLPAPISKVASGGELSRILLALQMALPEEVLPKLLVVDEVEAGLGGKAALLTGLKLKELSTKCQIILITHEATIASPCGSTFSRHEGGRGIVRQGAKRRRKSTGNCTHVIWNERDKRGHCPCHAVVKFAQKDDE